VNEPKILLDWEDVGYGFFGRRQPNRSQYAYRTGYTAVVMRRYGNLHPDGSDWKSVWDCIVFSDASDRIFDEPAETEEEGKRLVDEWLIANGYRLLDREPKLKVLL
jgi:hypothetical protein